MSKGFITGTNEELIKAYKESRDESYLKELIEANKGLINLLVSPYLTSIPNSELEDLTTDYNQIAVLCKSVKGDKIIGMVEYLEEHGIKVYSPRSEMFFERKEIKQVIGCMILCFPEYVRKLQQRDFSYDFENLYNYYDTQCIAAARELILQYRDTLGKEYRADAVSKSTDVGAVIPTTVLNQIVEKLESTGMILALVTRTAYKGGVSIPVSTVKPTATWVNEGAGSDKQKKNIAKDGMITFAYHKLRCAVAVSLEVDTMAISAFETLLINNIVEAMTKALEQAIIDGNGTGKPKGILAETPADGQTIESAAPSYSDLIKAEGALPMAYENGAVWCMSKKTFMEYVGMTDKNGQPIAKVNYGTSGKPERTLLGRTVVLCDYVASYSAALAKDTIFAFLFNFKDYVLNTNYSMGVKKYEDNDTDDQITKGIMLVDGKVVDKNSLVVVKKIEAV